jgi:hypothetical protein
LQGSQAPGDRDGSSERDAVLDKGCGKVGYSSLRRGTAQVITGEAGRQGAAKSEQGSLDRWAIAGRRSLLYSAAPHAAPSAARASSAGGAMRAGINGSLSAISSPAAQTARALAVVVDSRNSQEPPGRWKSPGLAAFASIAGPVIERSPLAVPIRKACRAADRVAMILILANIFGFDKAHSG